MGWFVVLLVALALALVVVTLRRWLVERLDPTLDEVRAAAQEARGVPLKALVPDGSSVGGLVPGAPHLELGTHVVERVAQLAEAAPVLVMTPDGAPFQAAHSPGRVLVSEQPVVGWSVGAAARELPQGVLVLDLGSSAPGDLVQQAARAAERRGLAVLIVAAEDHADRLVAAMAQVGHTDRVRRA